MLRELVDFQIAFHMVEENLLKTVTDWHSYPLDNQNQTFTSRMRLRITKERKILRVSMNRVRFDGTKPAEFFSFLRRFVQACVAFDSTFRGTGTCRNSCFQVLEAEFRHPGSEAGSGQRFPYPAYPKSIAWIIARSIKHFSVDSSTVL